MSTLISSCVPANGVKAIVARLSGPNDEDLTTPIECAIVDILFWAVDEQGNPEPYVFSDELGKPDRLDWFLTCYGGVAVSSLILESNVTNIPKAVTESLEQAIRRKQNNVIAYRKSPACELYRARIRAAMTEFAPRGTGDSDVSDITN